MYRVLKDFSDKTDRNHIYHAGDSFPRNGVDVDESRIKELSTSANKVREPLIIFEPDPVKVPVDSEESEKPIEKPRNARRGKREK